MMRHKDIREYRLNARITSKIIIITLAFAMITTLYPKEIALAKETYETTGIAEDTLYKEQYGVKIYNHHFETDSYAIDVRDIAITDVDMDNLVQNNRKAALREKIIKRANLVIRKSSNKVKLDNTEVDVDVTALTSKVSGKPYSLAFEFIPAKGNSVIVTTALYIVAEPEVEAIKEPVKPSDEPIAEPIKEPTEKPKEEVKEDPIKKPLQEDLLVIPVEPEPEVVIIYRPQARRANTQTPPATKPVEKPKIAKPPKKVKIEPLAVTDNLAEALSNVRMQVNSGMEIERWTLDLKRIARFAGAHAYVGTFGGSAIIVVALGLSILYDIRGIVWYKRKYKAMKQRRREEMLREKARKNKTSK
jgi:hypothetical protein